MRTVFDCQPAWVMNANTTPGRGGRPVFSNKSTFAHCA
jgi:hypothetical protein